MFSRYGMFMFAPDTGADGGAGAETPAEQTVDTTDYKALYEQEKSKSEKWKASFDKTASEIAELKKQSKAKMSEEEQRQAEQAEREALYKSTLAQLNEIKTSSVFAKSGIAENDYSDLSKKLVETCGDKASEVAESIIELVKKSNKSAVANAKNASIVDGARTPAGTSTQTDNQKGAYARQLREGMKSSNSPEEIQKYYHK